MKEYKVTIKSENPIIHDCIVENNHEFTLKLDHDPGFECLNQVVGDYVVAHLLDSLEIDWDIEEV